MNLIPYGDTKDDGLIQFNFVLPADPSPEVEEAAKELLRSHGFVDPKVSYYDKAGPGYTYVVAYARTQKSVDLSKIHVEKVEFNLRSRSEIETILKTKFKKELVVLGATIGTDAHTVGIDAIFNMKGWNGDYGLERYKGMRAINLGAQVKVEDLIALAKKEKADAILVSQVVDQKNSHIINFKNLAAQIKDLRKEIIFVIGGPRVSHQLALELDFDAGFGPGTLPSQVANYLVEEYARKKGIIL